MIIMAVAMMIISIGLRVRIMCFYGQVRVVTHDDEDDGTG